MSPARDANPLVPTALLAAALLAGCGGGGDNPGSRVPAADSLHVSCLQKPDPGPCRAAKPGYFYDYKSDSCRRFIWGGCQGNVPFETLEQCLKMCKGGK
ncbi:MAG: BPTI/Kunitz domain-containing protein [Thiohalocapsa sp.]|jgi:hypothetical protein|uniref:BPTI/Kunitz domain-containing protein n=1 Tax=Thiohalocapsa sp. TaxID=2497641 RepID=UPI0025DCA466|nr:BPTI/Kunitz domain-containing protein [Thiohalocapsa sp.]MCG6940131.1 BPTI/Kunitz domain-containing protein [Thiohalocapsa sp.]